MTTSQLGAPATEPVVAEIAEQPVGTEPTRALQLCPECGNPCLDRYDRYGPGGVACCPNCGWEGPPC